MVDYTHLIQAQGSQHYTLCWITQILETSTWSIELVDMTRKKTASNASIRAIHTTSDTESVESDSSFVAKENKTGKELQKMSRKFTGQLAPHQKKDHTPPKK